MKFPNLPFSADTADHERADEIRREEFERTKKPKDIDKIRFDEDHFGGVADAYVFPVLMVITSIILALVFGIVVIEVRPEWVTQYFVTLCAGLAAAAAMPLGLVASLRERRKLQSHNYVRSVASTDALTGLMNRRSFAICMREEVNRMARTGKPAAVILFDLDHFKKLNDEHGHKVGDEILTEIAAIAYSELRNPFDRLARWGGEEFVIMLNDMTEETARIVCERLRTRIAEFSITIDGVEISTTASFGGSLMRPKQAFSEAFRRADAALYEAKANGRDTVEFKRLLELAA
ncbi:MAG: GGDEF domain-containing protein [Hyphomonadaceae bacterium]|nr:GGDEF domain-containing protein [Hyphomonadaceae bacterium]